MHIGTLWKTKVYIWFPYIGNFISYPLNLKIFRNGFEDLCMQLILMDSLKYLFSLSAFNEISQVSLKNVKCIFFWPNIMISYLITSERKKEELLLCSYTWLKAPHFFIYIFWNASTNREDNLSNWQSMTCEMFSVFITMIAIHTGCTRAPTQLFRGGWVKVIWK